MNSSLDDFLAKPRGDKAIRLNISRNTLIAFLVSVALHLFVLLLVFPKINLNSAPQTTIIEVNLAPKATAPVATPSPIIPEEKPTPEPKPKKKVIAKKTIGKLNKSKDSDFSVPRTMTTPEPTQLQVPTAPKVPLPTLPDEPKTFEESMAQRRAQHGASESDAARQNAAAVAAEHGSSEEAKRDARIKNNFNNGTNGIFEITNLSSTNASFSFLGWTSSVSNARREFFDVEAKNGQDVRLAMIRRMIAIIRQHYQGDFDWESQRLGRTISKSARLEDSAELEDFLMQEFFGTNYKTKQ